MTTTTTTMATTTTAGPLLPGEARFINLDAFTGEPLIGPARLWNEPGMISADPGQPLAVAYNKALATVLGELNDRELAAMAAKLCHRLECLPRCTYGGSLSLAHAKVEAEALTRWNIRGGGNRYLNSVLNNDLEPPA